MASRIVAQLLVAGATTVLRAASQAWHQALANAHKTGVASEAAKTAVKSASGMTAQEARMILDINPAATWLEVTKRYKHMFEVNQKYGSFYLQSKVYRAWEALDQEYTQEGKKTPEEEAAVQQLLQQEPSSSGSEAAGGSSGGTSASGQQQQQQQDGKP